MKKQGFAVYTDNNHIVLLATPDGNILTNRDKLVPTNYSSFVLSYKITDDLTLSQLREHCSNLRDAYHCTFK